MANIRKEIKIRQRTVKITFKYIIFFFTKILKVKHEIKCNYEGIYKI